VSTPRSSKPPLPPQLPRVGQSAGGSLDLSTIEELHDIEVDDAPPSVETPLTAAPRASIPASPHKDPNAPVVLVVDDDPTVRVMLIRALGLAYTVYAAEDGISALDVLSRIPAPACIVSDWMMPKMDGIELAKRVRAQPQLKWTPLIFLTAKNHPLDVVQGINAGARHYIAKPFKMKELMDKVAHVLATTKK
jgi:CheY-like chemotaxis protein